MPMPIPEILVTVPTYIVFWRKLCKLNGDGRDLLCETSHALTAAAEAAHAN